MARQKCVYCGSTWQPEQDHVYPKSKGGKTTVPSCKRCNRSKRDKTLRTWLRELKAGGGYRWKAISSYNARKRNKIAVAVKKVRNLK